ncbi:MAG TPA: acyltransferase [Pyrinomonadaceae bacterium]|jgi:peptidoglycan/LPS O-acetylase OafA/YrhL|nr:acyltransferase [Pyrinomonadaceae bacterium]
MEPEAVNLKRRVPELDGLRGVAILLVLFYHYFQSAQMPAALAALGRLSWSGVDLFFVLSGFLVGGILLDARTSPNYFKTFYARRAYRILPLYALLCVAFWLIRGLTNAQHADPALAWLFSNAHPWYAYAALLQNFFMAYAGTLGPAWLGATWSLAIEEQFYLTLPFIIRYVRPRQLPYVLASILIAAPIVRAALRLAFAHGEFGAYVLMPARADALMLGVGAALLMRSREGREFLLRNRYVLYAAQVVLLGGMVWMSLKTTGASAETSVAAAAATTETTSAQTATLDAWASSRLYLRTLLSSLNYTWIALFYACMLLIAVTQRRSALARALRARWLMAAGVVAYGAYLFHQPFLGLCYGLARRGRVPAIENAGDAGLTLVALLLTLALAKISWSYFERPLVARGHEFRYREGAEPEASPGEASDESSGKASGKTSGKGRLAVG